MSRKRWLYAGTAMGITRPGGNLEISRDSQPQVTLIYAYYGCIHRCSDRRRCAQGNSTAEPLAVGHHLLLAHAAAVGRYRAHFQGSQRGRVSISLNSDYAYPLRPDSEADVAAAQRWCCLVQLCVLTLVSI